MDALQTSADMATDDTMQDLNIGSWLTSTFSWAVIGSTFLGLLPPIAVTVAIILGCLQIYENRTFQHWYNNRRQRQAAKKLARYKARVLKEQAIVDAVELLKRARTDARQVLNEAESKANQVLASHAIPPK